ERENSVPSSRYSRHSPSRAPCVFRRDTSHLPSSAFHTPAAGTAAGRGGAAPSPRASGLASTVRHGYALDPGRGYRLRVMTRSQLPRREMIAGTVGTGFALAVQPVSAATITTSADGLDVADVRIPSGGGDVPAYMARPTKRKGKPPIMLVV